jgi:TetR/AcrR family fatty acid metabolism transcriptional regulator
MARKVDREKRQEELLARAIEVFAVRGYQATTMDEIAERAGVSKGMLYIYFKNKEALFGAVFRWYGKMIAETMLDEIEEADDEQKQLERIASMWGRIAVEHRDYVPLFLDFWAAASIRGIRSEYAEDLSRIYDEYRDMISAIVERGMRKGVFRNDIDPRSVAYLLVGGMDGMFIQSWLSQPDEMEKLVVNSMKALLQGLCR